MKLLSKIKRAANKGEPISEDAALAVLRAEPGDLPEIMACANAARLRNFGNAIHLCSILNAKSGACGEDCAFCAQSARHNAQARVYELRSKETIVGAMQDAARYPIDHFGIVTSGESLNQIGVELVCDAIRSAPNPRVMWCASLGSMSENELRALKNAGLKRFHHNLETAESFFPEVCGTHTFADRIKTLRLVKGVGLEICSGGILGMGETLEERVEFAFVLAREKVDSIPLNFLVPIKGTPLENLEPMKPLEILKTVAMFRLTNPAAEIKVCAGRVHLRDLQSMIFHAGASGMMVGNLLTVAGQDVDRDLQMLKDLELIPVFQETEEAGD